MIKSHKISFENIRKDVKIRIFPIPIAYWSRFRIFKQNQENPDKIRMVRQSIILVYQLLWYLQSPCCRQSHLKRKQIELIIS